MIGRRKKEVGWGGGDRFHATGVPRKVGRGEEVAKDNLCGSVWV